MYARANEPRVNKAPSQNEASRSFSRPSPPAHHRPAHPLLELQRTIGNQATQRLLRAQLEGEPSVPPIVQGMPPSPGKPLGASARSFMEPRFGHNFSRIQVHGHADVQAKTEMNAPGDIYEQEAEWVADHVVSKSDSQSQGQKEENGSGAGRSVTPDSIGSSAGGEGQVLGNSLRSYFEPRFGYNFSRVRIHNDAQASSTAESLNARAFTVGQDVFFRRGAYAPHTTEGRHLIAHELTHVVQQGAAERVAGTPHSFLVVDPGRIQRDIAEDQLPVTPVEQIMADEKYIDNGIQRIEFYGANLAIIHYSDGSEIRLGLIPENISPPFEAVDYRTPRSVHLPYTSTPPSLGRGSIRFIPGGREAKFPPGFTYRDMPQLVEQVGRTIRFTHHPNGRIVPTEVNTISAPQLSQLLREGEAEYVRQMDEMSKVATEVLDKVETIALLGSVVSGVGPVSVPTTGSRTGAAAVTKVVGVFDRAQIALVRFFTRLLGRNVTESIIVEGVGFGGVSVALRESGELLVMRSSIQNLSKLPGQGALIHTAFENAAIQVARQVGARTARVALELVQNPAWANYLVSHGYRIEIVVNAVGGGLRYTRVLTKVFTL